MTTAGPVKFPSKRKSRHRVRPVKLHELPDGIPVEIRKAAGFAARAKQASLPWRTKTKKVRRCDRRAILAAASDEGHSWALAVCWLLRWCKPDGWQGPISERKRARRTA